MKQVFLATVMCFALVLSANAQFDPGSLTLDYAIANNTGDGCSAGCWNPSTDNLYETVFVDTVVNQTVRIISGADGSDTGNTLSVNGLTFNTSGLGLWGPSVTSDGVIYCALDDPAGEGIVRWASESDTNPVSQVVTGLNFARVIKAQGTGVDTFIATSGNDDNASVQIMTTTDGVNFAITDETPLTTTPDFSQGIKQGMTISRDGNIIFGAQGYGGSLPVKVIKSGATWVEDTTFAPSDTDVPTEPCPMDYDDRWGILFALGTGDGSDDVLYILDSTGGLLGSVPTGLNVGAYGYGRVDVDADNGVGYFLARNIDNLSGYVAGKFTYPVFVPLLSVDYAVWGLYD